MNNLELVELKQFEISRITVNKKAQDVTKVFVRLKKGKKDFV